MKELSIEEKAKRYDEALKRAMNFIENGDERERTIAESIFAGIMEESEDEKIRKELISYFTGWKDDALFRGIPHQKIIAWLERQEEKPTDKVEPKFKKGDWTVSKLDGKARQILEVHYDEYNNYYVVENDAHNIEEYDRLHHLWTIADAKDGDVLEFGDHGRLVTGILSFVNKTTGKVDASCLLEGDKFKVGVFYNLDTVKPHPATKEQRDVLIKAMVDAGYTFDFEKKELRKIGDIQFPSKKITIEEEIVNLSHMNLDLEENATEVELWKQYFLSESIKEQKPAWSEEDERMYRGLHNLIYSTPYCDSRKELSDWLESLKGLVQPKQEWKQENAMMYIGGSFFGQYAGLDPNDTNTIKKQANILLELVPSKEWSEENEKEVAVLEAYIRSKDWSERHIERALGIVDELVNKVKSLRPQTTWKPSNEQMDAIGAIINYRPFQRKHLDSLYDDLKQLKQL